MADHIDPNPRDAVAYLNGRVFTSDKARPWASGFIVSGDGVFLNVGDIDYIRSIARWDNLIIYDLRNAFTMPGIHDAHTHLLSASMQHLNESATGFDSSHTDIGEKLQRGACACAYAHVWGDWVIGNFYSQDQFPDGKPDRKYLDEAFPNTPVVVRDRTCHNILANTAALERAGYDFSAEDPHAGRYVRREDGVMTGELVESTATKMWLAVPKPAPAHVRRALRYGIQMCHKYGITSAQEASANTLSLHALRDLERDGLLTMDICTHIVYGPENFAQENKQGLHATLDNAKDFQTKHLHTNFVKFWMDGAPLPPHFTQCDLDQKGCADEITKYDGRGMTCKIHCAGEGSARRTLDVIEIVRRKNPDGPRHEIAHCNAIHKDDIRRFAELRVTAEMSPAMFEEANLLATYPHVFKWAFNETLAAGAKMTFGSDWFLPPTPNLFPSLAAIVETMGKSGDAADGDSLAERGGALICRIITLGGAEATGRGGETGSIEVGKRANFITLDRNLAGGQFANASVSRTWFEGRMVWNADEHGNGAFCA